MNQMYQGQMPQAPMQQQYAPQAPMQQQYAPQAPMQQQYAPQAPMQQQYAPQAQPSQDNGKGLMTQGRIVWILGKTLFEGKVLTDYDTKKPILDESGQQIIEYGFGLAIPKINPQTGQQTPEYTALMQSLQAEAFSLFPQGTPRDFAWKFKDGDTDVDESNVPYSKREGYAGHVVLACTTRIPIKFFIFQNGNNVVVNTGIKNGDYVNVQLNLKAHPAKGRGKAGMYTNPTAVQLIVAGKEIINIPSGDQLFGQNAPAYNGQVEAHTAPTMPGMGQVMPPMNNQMMAPQQQQPQWQQQAPAQNFQQPQHDPYYGVLPSGHQPQGNGQQFGQMNSAMPGTPNQFAQNGSGQNFIPNGMNGMTAPQNAYPSNGMPMPGQR